jgi:hypothetical protein
MTVDELTTMSDEELRRELDGMSNAAIDLLIEELERAIGQARRHRLERQP